MWNEITKESAKEEYLNIMYAADSIYPTLINAEKLNVAIDRKAAHFYLYTGLDFKIAVGFKWNKNLGMYKVLHFGVLGNAVPSVCSKLILEKMRDFATEHTVSSFYGIKPLKMDNVEVLKLHDEIMKAEGMKVVEETADYKFIVYTLPIGSVDLF